MTMLSEQQKGTAVYLGAPAVPLLPKGPTW